MTKRIIFVILFALASSLTAFAQQNDILKNDLGKSFKKTDVVRLNKGEAIRRAKAKQNITITTANETYTLSLEPRDLRAARYRAEDETAGGKREIEKTPLTTYKGKVVGDADSEVRLTMDDAGISGFFGSKNNALFIEPAAKYSKNAAADEFVVYKADDVLLEKDFDCPLDLTREIADGQQMVATNGAISAGLKTIEMATDADYEFGQSTGGAAGANAKVLSILNMVEGYYSSQLNLNISVVYQHTWSTPDAYESRTPRVDPQNCSSTIGKILCNFQDYWNANIPDTQVPRDVAHLFSNKSSVTGQGYAFIDVMCNNPSFAYGVSVRVNTTWNWEVGNTLITAHEIGHNLSATHTELMSPAPVDCYDTIMNTQISSYVLPNFCTASKNQIASHVAAAGGCLQSRQTNWVDFDGDGKTDVSIFRPSAGEWWINRSSSSQTIAAQFGLSTDKLTAGDFTGDGKTDIAIFRPANGYWYVLRSEDSSFFSFPFGTAGDVPAPADFDGDGKTDPAVFRPSTGTWYISQSGGSGTRIQSFGAAGDAPVTADYDGDSKADVSIYRPSTGEWWINRSTAGVIAFKFGTATDKPVQGDFTGDGKADAAIFRPANGYWYVLRSEDNSFFSFPFGSSGDVPTPGDYDGDGKFDAAVFRPSASTWYLNRSSAGAAIVGFGASTDLPVPSAFIP